MRVVVLGQGYVGLPLAVRAAEAGLDVIGLDVQDSLVDRLNSGSSHIDDVSDEALAMALSGGYRASSDPSDLAGADYIVVCVPTPLAQGGGPDLGYVEAAADLIAPRVTPGATVILESTTYPGTTEEVFAPRVLRSRPESEVFIAFSPERVDPGNTVYGIKNTPKVVGGLTPEATERAAQFYSLFVDTVVRARGAKEAEMAKLIENTFRHVNIALVNEMVRFCADLGIDLWDAIECAETKPFGYMAFRPGPGVGGHCIPVDPSYLSHRVKAELGYAFRMVELAEEINAAAPTYVASRVMRMLNTAGKPLLGSRVLLLGVTYKADIADCRESPADPLAKILLEWGADVRYIDPFVQTWRPVGTDSELLTETDFYGALSNCDVAVVLQAHSSFPLDTLACEPVDVLDTRGAVPTGNRVSRL